MPFLRPAEYFVNRFHPKQELAWLAYKSGKDLVLPWGRRSGKTEIICQIMIEDIEEYGKPCLFVAKTKDQARNIIWPKLETALRGQSDWRLYESTLEAYHKPSGALIMVRGVDKDADNLTGSGYRIIACDEYALWKKPEVYGKVLAPMLGDYNGQVIFSSTKRGKNHFYELHERAKKNPDKYFEIEATIFDNTFLSDEGREKVLSEYPGGEKNLLYQQEILNQYVVFEGMAFAIQQDQYTERRWDPSDFDHGFHWRGVDHGYSPDPTACVWIAYNKRKGYFQVYNEYKQPKLLIRQHSDVIRKFENYPFIASYSDIDPQVIAEYGDVGLELTPAQKADKQARILRIVNALQTGKLKIADNCTELLKEMSQYVWDQDGNDHLIDALNYGFNNLTIPIEEPPPEQHFGPRKFNNNHGYNHQSFDD